MTESNNRLVLKILQNRKKAFIKKIKDLEGTVSPEGQQYCRVMWGLKEAAVVFYSHVEFQEVMDKLFDFYLQRTEAKTLSRNINSLADLSPYHQSLYLDIVDFVTEHGFGILLEPEVEKNLLERAREREQQRDTLPRRKTTTTYEPAEQA